MPSKLRKQMRMPIFLHPRCYVVVIETTWQFLRDITFNFLSAPSLSLLLSGSTYFRLVVTARKSAHADSTCEKKRKKKNQTSIAAEYATEDARSRKEGGEKAYLLKYSWRVYIGRTTHTRGRRRHSGVYTTRTHTDTLRTQQQVSLPFFFVVYRAVSGIDASVSSPRAEKRFLSLFLSLSFSFLFPSHVRRELCFRNVRATHTNACTRPWASARAHTHTHTCTYDSRCVCVVQTDVRSRAARLVGKREESKVEGSAPRYSSTFGSACQKALFTVSRENELFNSSRCRW